MKSYLFAVLAVLAVGYWCYMRWQDSLATTELRIAREARQHDLKQSVADMANRANAISDWPELLAGGKKIRATPIMTAELQKLWLSSRPVLFVGNVQDVAISDDGTHKITLTYNNFSSQPMLMGSEVRVILSCKEEFATQLMKTMKSEKYPKVWADAAVIASIERLGRSTEKDAEGDTVAVLTGIGKCKDAMQLTERLPMSPKRKFE